MHPIGTHVTVRSVDHLPGEPQRLIGRQGIVGDHKNGVNIVTALGPAIAGYYAFPDHALTATGHGSAPSMPRRYRIRGYYTPCS